MQIPDPGPGRSASCWQTPIRDTGVGIPAEKLAAIIKDFTRLNDPGAIDPGGTGLGLTITKQLIRLMGGDIWVESRDNRGSTFHFRIQLEKSASGEAEAVWGSRLGKGAEKPGPKNVTPLTILLAEDFEVNQKLVVPFLEQYGHTVITAENGQLALDILERQVVDVVLMDIVNEICQTIILKFPQEAARIEKAVHNKDFDTIAAVAHALKSGAKSIDARPLLRLIKHMAKAGRSRDLQGARARLDEFLTRINEVVEKLKESV